MATSRVKNQASAVSETARILAGRARWLYEMATGESGDSNEPPALPRNPQGLYGVDHSGPPYGVALRHGVAHNGRPFIASASSYWTDVVNTVVTASQTTQGACRIWVKPHVPGQGPYVQLTVGIAAAYVTSSSTLTISVVNRTIGNRTVEATQVVSSSSVAVYDAVLDVPVVSGWNDLEWSLAATSGGVELNGWAINQVAQIRD